MSNKNLENKRKSNNKRDEKKEDMFNIYNMPNIISLNSDVVLSENRYEKTK